MSYTIALKTNVIFCLMLQSVLFKVSYPSIDNDIVSCNINTSIHVFSLHLYISHHLFDAVFEKIKIQIFNYKYKYFLYK